MKNDTNEGLDSNAPLKFEETDDIGMKQELCENVIKEEDVRNFPQSKVKTILCPIKYLHIA